MDDLDSDFTDFTGSVLPNLRAYELLLALHALDVETLEDLKYVQEHPEAKKG